MEGIFPGLLKQLMFNSDECGLAETLQRQDHAIGQQAVHQDPAQQVQSRHKSGEQPSAFTTWNISPCPQNHTVVGKKHFFCDVQYCAKNLSLVELSLF